MKKILLILFHYYSPSENSIYSSTDANKRDQRKDAIHQLVLNWRAMTGGYRKIDFSNQQMQSYENLEVTLDIFILTIDGKNLLDHAFLNKYAAKIINIDVEDPRMLPFAAHELIKQYKSNYDYFIYSEDDLFLHDIDFLNKRDYFENKFGSNRLLQFNRYEISRNHYPSKTYIDGNLNIDLVDRLWSYVEEKSNTLSIDWGISEIWFERAKNPHSGIFILSQEQAKIWVSQHHFLDYDCSFVSPLESAGSLSLLKTFSLYKAAYESISYYEIEHIDQKYSYYPWVGDI